MSVSMLQTVAFHLGRVLPSLRQALETGAGRQSSNALTGSNNLSTVLPGLSLSARFAFAAAVVLCNGMALLGGWVVTQIERGVLQNAAVSESVYVQSLLTPIVPLLTNDESDSSQIGNAIDNSLLSTPLWDRLTSVAIWLPDGSIIYSTDKGLTGRKYVPPSEVLGALSGDVRTTLSDQRLLLLYSNKPDEATVRTVYTPLHEKDGNKVIAVVEIVSNADPLKTQLDSIRKRTWIVVGLSTLLMIGALFGIVQKGSQTIEEQRLEIERRLAEEVRLNQINKAQSERLKEVNRRGIELGEEHLRRISSDLEDGPAQLLALALLRMYELKPAKEQKDYDLSRSSTDVVDVITGATTGALKEIREISSGLLLPELRRLSSYEAVDAAIRAHEQATGTLVERNISSFPQHLPLPVTICIFRLVQEGLTNAYCHAGARGQKVTGFDDGESVVITVSDNGPGFSSEEMLNPGSSHLGLRGLRQRVESIGGTFTVQSTEGEGTQLSGRFPYSSPVSQAKETTVSIPADR